MTLLYSVCRPLGGMMRAYPGDAGLDLLAAEPADLLEGEVTEVPTGLRLAIPDGYFGLIKGRSSTYRRYRCLILDSVIDSGFRGEILIRCYGLRGCRHRVEAGARIAQLLVLPVLLGDPKLVDVLPPSVRGDNGFGSSGV